MVKHKLSKTRSLNLSLTIVYFDVTIFILVLKELILNFK